MGAGTDFTMLGIYITIVIVIVVSALIVITFERDQGQLGFMGVGLVGAIINPITSSFNGLGGSIATLFQGFYNWMKKYLMVWP